MIGTVHTDPNGSGNGHCDAIGMKTKRKPVAVKPAILAFWCAVNGNRSTRSRPW